MKPTHEMTDREFSAEYGADVASTQATINAAKGRGSDTPEARSAWESLWRLRDRLEPDWRDRCRHEQP
jgi:hypothetical protein